MKSSSRIILAPLLFLAGTSLVFLHLRYRPASLSPPSDLALSTLRLKVLPDRSVEISGRVANRGPRRSGPASITLRSTWGEEAVPVVALGSGERRSFTWRSRPLEAGDYGVSVRVAPVRPELDRDESNNVALRVLHVPEEAPRGRAVPMPQVVGLDRRTAYRKLDRAGFRRALWHEPSHGEPRGRIVQQWPEPGSRVPRGTKPVLVAAAVTSVPRVEGLSLSRARAALRRAGLEPGPIEFRRSGVGTRRVVGQHPAPGASLAIGSGVGLTVAEPRPVWPLVTGSLMCVLAALMGLTTQARPGLDWPAGSLPLPSGAGDGPGPRGRRRLATRVAIANPSWYRIAGGEADVEVKTPRARAPRLRILDVPEIRIGASFDVPPPDSPSGDAPRDGIATASDRPPRAVPPGPASAEPSRSAVAEPPSPASDTPPRPASDAPPRSASAEPPAASAGPGAGSPLEPAASGDRRGGDWRLAAAGVGLAAVAVATLRRPPAPGAPTPPDAAGAALPALEPAAEVPDAGPAAADAHAEPPPSDAPPAEEWRLPIAGVVAVAAAMMALRAGAQLSERRRVAGAGSSAAERAPALAEPNARAAEASSAVAAVEAPATEALATAAVEDAVEAAVLEWPAEDAPAMEPVVEDAGEPVVLEWPSVAAPATEPVVESAVEDAHEQALLEWPARDAATMETVEAVGEPVEDVLATEPVAEAGEDARKPSALDWFTVDAPAVEPVAAAAAAAVEDGEPLAAAEEASGIALLEGSPIDAEAAPPIGIVTEESVEAEAIVLPERIEAEPADSGLAIEIVDDATPSSIASPGDAIERAAAEAVEASLPERRSLPTTETLPAPVPVLPATRDAWVVERAMVRAAAPVVAFVPWPDPGQPTVTWHPETAPAWLALVTVHDPGRAVVMAAGARLDEEVEHDG